MTELDRTNAPAFKEIEKVEIQRARKMILSNGIPVYLVDAGTEEVLKIDFVFDAGVWASFDDGRNPSRLLASATNQLIPEGTSSMSSAEIAEKTDFFGAFIQTGCGKDIASVSLITLGRHLKNTLPIVEEIIKDASFPDQEIETYLKNARQKFMVDSEKVNIISRKKFNEVVFGHNHPYGRQVEINDFNTLFRKDMKAFFSQYYTALNCRIIVAGKINENVVPFLENHFGNWKDDGRKPVRTGIPLMSSEVKNHFIKREGQVQSAICIGRPLFLKNHPDYAAMKVLNVLLGGYFGSRLMMNLREEKGYTYGIGSSVFPQVHEGCFFISTEVGTDVTGDALKEIFSELQRLTEKPVGEDELQKVRNYMMGEFLRSVDGPFALADKFKGLLFYGLDYDFYDNFLRTIKTISPDRICELARKYLQKDQLYEVVVGSRESVSQKK